jgi:uncharacterized protein
MPAHFLLFYDYVDDILERRAPHRDAHLALIREWKEDGRIVLAGALGDPVHGAAIAFRVDDPADVDHFMDADPYREAGLVTGYRVEPWLVV